MQRLQIDGEDLTYKEFVKFETLHNALEVMVDFDHMMSS